MICPEIVLTEDSNSGYEFYKALFGELCFSAEGKSNILHCLQENMEKRILAIVDGAAFGSEMQRIMRYIYDAEKQIVLYAPESFEYLLLKSELTGSTYHITEETYEYADSRKYFSWEEFYTDYLVQNTKDTIYQYSKKKLSLAYLTTGSMKRIQNQIPEKIVNAVKVRY